MFGQPPRTYERKKVGVHHHPSSSTIIRENVPPNPGRSRDRSPRESMLSNNGDLGLEYDPFETTFDRLAKDAVVPPIPADQVSNYCFSDSSNDGIRSKIASSEDDDSLDEAPLENPKPLPTKKRYKRKQNEDEMTVTTVVLSRNTYKRGKAIDQYKDENREPNVVLVKVDAKDGKKKPARKKPQRKKTSPGEKKTKISVAKTGKSQTLEDSLDLKRCTVILKRLSSDKSKNIADFGSDDIKKKRLAPSISQSINAIETSSIIPLENNQSFETIDIADKSIVIEKHDKVDEKLAPSLLKNPIVPLMKLRLAPGSSRQHFSSSTPNVSRTTTYKLLHLSPIGKNEKIDESKETEDLTLASLPSESMIEEADSVAASFPNSTWQTFKSCDEKKPTKVSSKILSVSPDPEPSRLLFDDTIQKSKVSNIEKLPDTTEASTTSVLMGFERKSSEDDSLSVTYNQNESIEGSTTNNLTNDNTEFAPFATENPDEYMETSTKDPFMGFSDTNIKTKNDATIEKSQKHDTDDEWSTISESLSTTNDKTERREIIEQLSSNENTSSDGISFINASPVSNRQMETNEKVENSTIDVDESSRFETNESTKKINDEISEIDSQDFNRLSLQPVVILSRLNVLDNDLSKVTKNTLFKSPSDTLESISQLSLEEQQSINSFDSSSKNVQLESTYDNEESSITMDTSTIHNDENSTVKSAVEEPLEDVSMMSEKNLSSSSSESLKLQMSAIEESPKEMENLKSMETNAEESSRRDNRVGSIQPIVLLTRLNDPFRINNRRKKNRSPNLELDAISENNVERTMDSADANTKLEKILDTMSDAESKIDDEAKEIPKKREIVLRRKKYSNWNLGLSMISESDGAKATNMIDEDTEMIDVADTGKNRESRMNVIDEETPKSSETKSNCEGSSQIVTSQQTTDSCGTSLGSNFHNESVKDDKPLFLLPGKLWARSLSILNQVHNRNDLESLAVGKGKKWRQSAQNLLDMQQQGLIQSCVKKNEDDKELRSYGGLHNSGAWIPGSSQPDTSRLFGVSSPGRFVRRVSIRVVPDSKSFDDIKDTPFLEAYGITSGENRKTIETRRTLIAPRKTLADIVFEKTPKTLHNVRPRDVVLSQCEQETALPFEDCYPESFLACCRKIGEGVYGEVFLYESETEKNVIKIIPIEGDLKINGERQKKFDEILSEIVIAKELHNLRFAATSSTSSFVEVKKIRCVMGKYPSTLIELWKDYDDEKSSENDCPSVFEEKQLYIVLELGHGGEDLEAFVFQNAAEAHALFFQTALALAVAEESLEFEHRDLHWGNLLISRTNETQIDFKLRDQSISTMSKGVKVSVIDFTLSRMSYQGCSIFNDLSMDEDLFVAQGEYQFDIYRHMRQKIENNWQRFEPFTNILWLHYILDKMITAVRYKRKNSKIHQSSIAKLQELKNEILQYQSAVDFVTNCDKVTRLQASRSRTSTLTSTC